MKPTKHPHRRRASVDRLSRVGLLALAVLLGGCQDEPVNSKTNNPGKKPPPPPPPPPAAAAAAAAASAKTAALPPLPKREFQERDFAESEANRDPFHSFLADLVAQNKPRVVFQHRVLAQRYSLEELKLSGVVIGAPSRALLIDTTGFGWMATAGDFVGKVELVHSGGASGVEVPINWRVDRIRASDVVFVREDPSHPEIPPTTRVLTLRTVEEEARAASMANGTFN